MDFISTMARIVEQHGWNHVLATLHNLALSQGRIDIADGLKPICHDDPHAADVSEDEIESDGELD